MKELIDFNNASKVITLIAGESPTYLNIRNDLTDIYLSLNTD
jgi:hypothetical protein